jgi:predicted ribosome quality control (RQC) complex YloA/Tae2 family protein
MNTQDVIDTISRATNDLFATLRSNDEVIKGFESRVELLEARIKDLEHRLDQSRQSHEDYRAEARQTIAALHDELEVARKTVTEATKEQTRLKDIILNVAAAVDSVVNPGEKTMPTMAADLSPKPVLVDDKGLPHDPETGRFVEPEKATGTDGPFKPYWEW